MSDKNSFKELEEENIKEYEENIKKVKNSLDANVGGVQFFTDIIELYFSKVLNFFIKASGGELPEDKENNNNQ